MDKTLFTTDLLPVIAKINNREIFLNSIIVTFFLLTAGFSMGQCPSVTETYGVGVWNSYAYNSNNLTNLKGTFTNGISVNNSTQFTADWGAGAPSATCGATANDVFTTSHRMNRDFASGWYVFTYSSDDGIRISTDGGTTWNVVNNFGTSTVAGTSATVFLSGPTNVRIDQRENTGNANVSVTICQMDGGNVFGNGFWNAYVFDDMDIEFSKYQGTFTNSSLNFCNNWGAGQPSIVGQRCGKTMDDNYFSVRYVRQFAFPAGNYYIRTITDDGVRIGVNTGTGVNWNVVNNWTTSSYDVTSTVLTLNGAMQYIYYDMRENTGNAMASFNILKVPDNPTGITSNLANNAICTSGGSITLTATGIEGSVYWYTGSCGGTYVGTGNSITVSPTSNTTYYARNRNYSDAGCGNTLELFSPGCVSANVTVGLPPSAVSAGSNQTICGGNTTLSGSATASSTTTTNTAISQNFNSGIGTWTTQNNTSGGTPASANWTLASSTGPNSSTSGGTQFIYSNSDLAGSGNSGNTVLQSPAFSTMSYTSLNLTFRHYYRATETAESINVEVSTNGAAWTTLQTWTQNQGASNAFGNVSINMNAYVNNPTLYIRFRYVMSWDWYWCIDDIAVSGSYTSAAPLTYAWTPSTGLSSTVISNPVASPASTTAYTMTATSNGCSASSNVTVNVASPAGNPATFGANQWNVYGYNGYSTTISSNTYRGYYIQPALSADNYGISTPAFWSIANSPSGAGTTADNGNLWNGCSVDVDYHTFIHKRKGFPCGTYNITMKEWDDIVKVIINGVTVWGCDQWHGNGSDGLGVPFTGNCGSIGSGLTPNGINIGTTSFTVQLDANSEIEIQVFEGAGGSTLGVEITKMVPAALSTGTSSRMCAASGSAFIDFVDLNGKLIASINPNGNNLGNVTVTSYVGSPGAMFACNTGNNPLYQTAYMGRTWVVKSSAYPTADFPGSPVILRMPFEDGELTAMNNTASTTTTGNPNDNSATVASLMMTKHSRTIPAQEDNSTADNCTGGITRSVLQTGYGALNTLYPSIPNAQYLLFNVQQFSEMYLNKSFGGSPLPVTLTDFSAHCNSQNDVEINWSTASEQNSQKFIIEKSRDMDHWIYVSELAAAGNSSILLSYESVDADPYGGTSYYRLVQVDYNGTEKTYGPISVSCSGEKSSMTVFPNPAQGSFTVEIISQENLLNAEVRLTDLTGKVIETRKLNITEGRNQVLFEETRLQMGTYIVTLHSGGKQLYPVKLVVN